MAHGSWLMAPSRAPRLRKSVTVQAEGIKSAAKTVKIVPKELISRRLSPGFQLKVTWLMWHKLGNQSNTKETSMSKYLEHNKHPRGDTYLFFASQCTSPRGYTLQFLARSTLYHSPRSWRWTERRSTGRQRNTETPTKRTPAPRPCYCRQKH